MPLIVAVILYGGTFFGWVGHETAHDEIARANVQQQEFLKNKHAAIALVAFETLRKQGG